MIGLFSTAQINFEKGYYINNQGDKIDCLIKNIDWKNNPNQIKYKLNETDDAKTLTIENVLGFGIDNEVSFERHTVYINKSSNTIANLDYNKEPNFERKTLLLRVIVKGKSNLYQYTGQNLINYFFFNETTGGVESLVYKRYKTSTDNKIHKNNKFKQQLWNNVKCPDASMSKVNNLSYTKSSLEKYFIEYNKCNGVNYTSYSKKGESGKLNISLRPGVNFSSLETKFNNLNPDVLGVNYGSQTNFRAGIEFEYVMPFNKNKWSVFIEPTYQYFKANKKTINDQETIIDYKSIELPIGVRHYMFLNQESKLFVNAAFLFDFHISGEKILYDYSNDRSISSGGNFALGLGYKYKKYSAEFRYHSARNLLNGTPNSKGDYNTSSIIFGYTLF